MRTAYWKEETRWSVTSRGVSGVNQWMKMQVCMLYRQVMQYKYYMTLMSIRMLGNMYNALKNSTTASLTDPISAEVPSCFYDDSVSQGGGFCPDNIEDGERINCQPDGDPADEETCLARGCYWCPVEAEGVPSCFAPRQYGYRMVGEPVQIHKGKVSSVP